MSKLGKHSLKNIYRCENLINDLITKLDGLSNTLRGDGNYDNAIWLQDNQINLYTLHDYLVAMRSANNGQAKL